MIQKKSKFCSWDQLVVVSVPYPPQRFLEADHSSFWLQVKPPSQLRSESSSTSRGWNPKKV